MFDALKDWAFDAMTWVDERTRRQRALARDALAVLRGRAVAVPPKTASPDKGLPLQPYVIRYARLPDGPFEAHVMPYPGRGGGHAPAKTCWCYPARDSESSHVWIHSDGN